MDPLSFSGMTSGRAIHYLSSTVMNAEDFEDLFYLPLPQAAFVEFEDLQERLIGLPGPQSEDDVWSYIWGNGTYTSQRL